MKKKNYFNLFLLFLTYVHQLNTRSPLRPQNNSIPVISVQWEGEKKIYKHTDSHYEIYPLFTIFNKKEFNKYTLTQKKIRYGISHKHSINTQVLNRLIEELLHEIKKKKKTFYHFTILQNKNFNRKKKCGLLVLKFNDYPFVLKLFMESPQTFINPYCKGLESWSFFMMAGGANRHLSGLTRIKNLENVKNKIAHNPKWASRIKTPRKWFWVPKNNKWLHITGINITDTPLTSSIPGTYAIIADAIDTQDSLAIAGINKKKIIMNLCNDLDVFIDPHSDNFIFHYDKKQKKACITIIDTEHFPTMVGLKEKKQFRNYNSWILFLAGKCFHDTFLRTKKQRLLAQKTPHTLILQDIR